METIRKRPLSDDEDGRPTEQRKVRFPKGKKVKGEGGAKVDDDLDSLINPDVAAKRRAKRRKPNKEDVEVQVDLSKAEIRYQENVNFVEDGIQIEPFNLDNEREEGYFDANGNYVEYARDNQIKDAWLDSAEIDTNLAAKLKEKSKEEKEKEEEFQDLSSDDVGKIKRKIANILQPGETIIQALKRLKGDKKTKMSDETKELFDELTESAMKLMENGEYNAYHEERETFEREAEGYERLARAKGGSSAGNGDCILSETGEDDNDILTFQIPPNNINNNDNNDKDDDDFDMFGDDEKKEGNKNDNDKQPDANLTGGATGSDYEYDPNSGYYYSSSLGYYYDATTGLYCSASTGTWYSFDEESGTYKEVDNASSTEIKEGSSENLEK
ncbi:hypothetical protein LUZ60_003021 [Juncus effusus]|nr:hypothetical protein LUZ60_003021 [Juncus effusus]